MRNLFLIFLAVLIFSPLAFGAVEPWSLAVMESLAIFALCLYFYLPGENGSLPYYSIPGILPLSCFLGYVLLQMIPLPVEFVRMLSPNAYGIYAETVGATGRLTWIPLTVNVKSTLAEFLRYSSYAAFYMLTVQLLARKEYLKKTVTIIMVFAAMLAIFGMLQQFVSNGRIYWIRDISTKWFYGPFANRNHYAGLIDMIFPLALGLFLALKPAVSYESFRNRISDMINQRDLNNHILVGIGAVIMATSVFLTLSRVGIVSLCMPLLFMGGMLFLRTGERKRSWAIVLISLFIALIVGWFGWGQVISRFDDLKDAADTVRIYSVDRPDRVEMWKDSAAVISDFITTGSGMGSFVKAYPKYRASWTDYLIDHAHNDYLELLAEGGMAAFVLVSWFMLTIFYKTYRTILRRRDSYSVYIYTGCITGIVSMLIFSLTDFNMHIGSNGLYFFFLAGLAVSAAHTRLHRGLEPTYLGKLPASGIRLLRIIMPALLVICLMFNIGVLAGEYFFLPVKNAKATDNNDRARIAALREDADRASLSDPLEAKYYYSSGMLERRLANPGEAIRLFEQAVALDPMNGEYLQRLGLSLYEKGQTEAGDRLIRAGTLHDIANPARYKFYAIHLFSTGRKEAAAECIRKALVMAPDRAEDLIMLMMLRGLNDEEIRNTLPERAAPHLAFADYLAQTGKHAAAEKGYLDALFYASKEKKTARAYFMKAYDYYIKRELVEDALSAVKQGIGRFPADSLLHFTAGTLYERLGMNATAIEEYRKAVSLDITRTDAHKKMEDLIRKSGKP